MPETRQLRRLRPANDLSVAQLSLTELHHELQRRVKDLQEQKQDLQNKIVAIDRELQSLGPFGTSGGDEAVSTRSARTRGVNEAPLKVVLARVLKDQPLTTREAAEAVLATGYVSNSQNFTNTVGVSLHREPRFVKTDGKWSVVEDVGDADDADDAGERE